MRWLADECVAASLVRDLRRAGHDVLYVAEVAASLSDTEVIQLASREERLLLTIDKEFGELVFGRGEAVPGVILLRIDPENAQHSNMRLFSVIDHFEQSLFGRYVVVDDVRFRSRPL